MRIVFDNPLFSLYPMVVNISTSYNNLALSQIFKRVNNTLKEMSEDILGGPLGDSLSRDPSLSGDLLEDIIDGKYRLISKIGEGGMGTVYKVRHLLLNKEVALKTFSHSNLSAQTWQRFQREAQTIARLNHANIVQVFDFGIVAANAPYYTMELLQGESLADCLTRSKRLTLAEALSTFAAVAAALSHAHNLGIVHRDIKPGNIFLDYSQNGKVVIKVVDFGLAKLATAASEANSQKETDNGLVFGSPLYMSPEQADGRSIDQRTDIYSFGCALFESLSGFAPFVGENAFATIQKHIAEPVPRLSEQCPDLRFAAEVDIFLGKVMAKDRLERYQNFDDLLVDLQKLHQATEGRAARILRNNLKAVVLAGQSGFEDSPAFNHSDNQVVAAPRRYQFKPDVGTFVLAAWAVIVIAALFLLFGEGGLFSGSDEGQKSANKAQDKNSEKAKAALVSPANGELRYYRSAVNSQGQRLFKFPYGVKLGYLSWDGKKPVPAQGEVVVPAKVNLHFFIGDETIAHPELLKGFHSDDIYGVTCGGQDNLNSKVFESIVSNLSKLHKLDCAHAEFSCKYAPYLNRLSNLKFLEVDDSNIDGFDLAEYSGLRDLIKLDAGQVPHISQVLTKLSGSNLIILGVAGCALTDEDLQAIVNSKCLRDVSLRASDVSNHGISLLSQLPNLQYLTLTPRAFDAGLIKAMGKLSHLKWLTIDNELWTDAQRAQLAAVLPKTAISNGKSGAALMR